MGIQTDTRAIWIPSNGGIENEKLYAPLLRDTTTARCKLKDQMGKAGVGVYGNLSKSSVSITLKSL